MQDDRPRLFDCAVLPARVNNGIFEEALLKLTPLSEVSLINLEAPIANNTSLSQQLEHAQVCFAHHWATKAGYSPGSCSQWIRFTYKAHL